MYVCDAKPHRQYQRVPDWSTTAGVSRGQRVTSIVN